MQLEVQQTVWDSSSRLRIRQVEAKTGQVLRQHQVLGTSPQTAKWTLTHLHMSSAVPFYVSYLFLVSDIFIFLKTKWNCCTLCNLKSCVGDDASIIPKYSRSIIPCKLQLQLTILLSSFVCAATGSSLVQLVQ